MSKCKLTPFLILYPLAIILYTYNVSRVWTPFSLFFIIAFITIVSSILLCERLLVKNYDRKKIWTVEILILLILLLYYLFDYYDIIKLSHII